MSDDPVRDRLNEIHQLADAASAWLITPQDAPMRQEDARTRIRTLARDALAAYDDQRAADPNDGPPGPRLMLNAYGRRCYDAGHTAACDDAIRAFVARVNARAEADILAGHPITGAHFRALTIELDAL